jgi:hypothetical protein
LTQASSDIALPHEDRTDTLRSPIEIEVSSTSRKPASVAVNW